MCFQEKKSKVDTQEEIYTRLNELIEKIDGVFLKKLQKISEEQGGYQKYIEWLNQRSLTWLDGIRGLVHIELKLLDYLNRKQMIEEEAISIVKKKLYDLCGKIDPTEGGLYHVEDFIWRVGAACNKYHEFEGKVPRPAPQSSMLERVKRLDCVVQNYIDALKEEEDKKDNMNTDAWRELQEKCKILTNEIRIAIREDGSSLEELNHEWQVETKSETNSEIRVKFEAPRP
ncbi:hypothetical protein ES703_100347 [subsurface metagenome]